MIDVKQLFIRFHKSPNRQCATARYRRSSRDTLLWHSCHVTWHHGRYWCVTVTTRDLSRTSMAGWHLSLRKRRWKDCSLLKTHPTFPSEPGHMMQTQCTWNFLCRERCYPFLWEVANIPEAVRSARAVPGLSVTFRHMTYPRYLIGGNDAADNFQLMVGWMMGT